MLTCRRKLRLSDTLDLLMHMQHIGRPWLQVIAWCVCVQHVLLLQYADIARKLKPRIRALCCIHTVVSLGRSRLPFGPTLHVEEIQESHHVLCIGVHIPM